MEKTYSMMVQGKMNFMGIDIPVVSGGFGEGKMCVTDKTVAEIHGQETREIRRRINDNIRRFKDGIDYIDLKIVVDESHNNLLDQLGYSKMQIAKAEHIYILSERGYAKLIKIMDDDKSWEVHDKLVDDYFNMKLELQQKQPSYMITDSVERAKRWIEEEEERRALALQLEQQAPKVGYFDKFIDTDTTFTSTQVAKVYGISSARKLNILLNEKHVIYKQGRTWLVYETTNKKWFKEVLNEFGTQLRFTALGVVEVAKLLDVELNEDAIKEAE